MAIYWFDSDKVTELDFPFLFGSFSGGQSVNKLIWFYSDSSISNLRMKIEENGDESWKAFQIAKDYNSRPQAFIDYLSELYWFILPANTWQALWIKFDAEKVEPSESLYTINLRLTGETLG